MVRKTIAGKAALLNAIQHPGTATHIRDDRRAHEPVAHISSYIANAKDLATNGNGDEKSDPRRQGKIMASHARRRINRSFDTILNPERAASQYYRTALKMARRQDFIPLHRYAALKARLWAGRKIAESLISEIRDTHLKHIQRCVESLDKSMFMQHTLTVEGFDPFGSQEDHMNTRYGIGSGNHTAPTVTPFGLETIREEEEEK